MQLFTCISGIHSWLLGTFPITIPALCGALSHSHLNSSRQIYGQEEGKVQKEGHEDSSQKEEGEGQETGSRKILRANPLGHRRQAPWHRRVIRVQARRTLADLPQVRQRPL